MGNVSSYFVKGYLDFKFYDKKLYIDLWANSSEPWPYMAYNVLSFVLQRRH